jgi:hypothetical protein
MLPPIVAAQSLVDRHIVKMILESVQLLSTAHRLVDGKCMLPYPPKGRKVKRWKLDDQREDAVSGHTCQSSICCLVPECQDNYYWLFNHDSRTYQRIHIQVWQTTQVL